MKVLKLNDSTFKKVLQADRISKRILSITYPSERHNSRLLRIERIKGNLLSRCVY